MSETKYTFKTNKDGTTTRSDGIVLFPQPVDTTDEEYKIIKGAFMNGTHISTEDQRKIQANMDSRARTRDLAIKSRVTSKESSVNKYVQDRIEK